MGAFEVQRLIGAGGMGEVYLARDVRLNRDVALKVLPEALTLDDDRLGRFEREAQVLASLNHPNIAAIYGVEESPDPVGPLPAGRKALVLELVDGPTLADRLARGPLPLDEALAVAKQIAEGVEAAHRQGVIHRDLKPANIKLRPDGRVKVLDFGLAKLIASSVAPPSHHDSVTGEMATVLSPVVTSVGVIVGSAAYMSPEQARGRPTDKRSDVWAFGAVVFEMLTGERAFKADDVAATIAAVLERQPRWEQLPPHTPASIRRLLRRCLEKDPQRRLHDLADARLDIEDASTERVDEPITHRARRAGLFAAAVAATAIVAGVAGWLLQPSSRAGDHTAAVSRLVIAPDEPISETEGVLVMSRDGRRVAYAAGPPGHQHLVVREMDQFAGRPVPDTEGVVSAAFSPDGESLAFIAGRKLRTIAIAGGAALTLRDRVDGAGLAWTADQTILYNPGTATGIWRMPIGGGEPSAVTTPGPRDNDQRFPELLPGSHAIVFNARGGVALDKIYVESLQTHERRQLLTGTAAHYLPSGYLVFVDGGTLYAVRFDASSLEMKGTPVTLLEGVSLAQNGQPLISYSDAGSLVYVPTTASAAASTLVWVDLAGREQPAGASGMPWAQPRLSPDGRRVVTALRSSTEDLWLIDLERGTSSRLTTQGTASFPVWFPDGRHLAFSSAKEASYAIYRRPVDGSAPDERLLSANVPNYVFSASPNGDALIFVNVDPTTLQDIRVLRADQRDTSQPFLTTPFREGAPAFSPDGRSVAYISDESGRLEVYVRPYPGPGEKWAVSNSGGNEPVWSRDGRTLFYRAGNTMMAADVQVAPAFSIGKARKLFDGPYERSNALWANYDTSPDGQRLLMIRRERPPAPASHINVVLNWLEDLAEKLPAK